MKITKFIGTFTRELILLLAAIVVGGSLLASAALWWTVFNKSLEHAAASDARYYADDAVQTVYGKVKP